MQKYNDKYIINRIINFKFSFTDLDPKRFPMLVHGTGLYCPMHASSHTGTLNSRIYYNEEYNIYYIHCYVEGKNFFASDYVSKIMCEERHLFNNPKEFLLTRISEDEFIALYNLFAQNKKQIEESQFKKKCEYIDNTFIETGNAIDYIEALYTA